VQFVRIGFPVKFQQKLCLVLYNGESFRVTRGVQWEKTNDRQKHAKWEDKQDNEYNDKVRKEKSYISMDSPDETEENHEKRNPDGQ
jgi:hypothetical protein